jgi:hypothetical protein
MKVIINGTLNIGGINKTNISKEKPFTPLGNSFNVWVDILTCSISGNPAYNVNIYSSSSILDIGSTLYTNITLTIPTTYYTVSNPNDPGNTYFIITGNTITSLAFCD